MNSARRTPPSDQVPKTGPGGGATSEPRSAKGERAFDTWLKRGLHRLYDDVAGEPLPDALRKLIEEDLKK